MVSFFFINSFFVFLFSLCIYVCSAVDTISENFTLWGSQTIVSAGKTFELGFFTPGTSSHYYIGIWYIHPVHFERFVVWVANREKPIIDSYSSVLKISNGNLILLDGNNQTLVWSTGLSSTSSYISSIEAVLLEDGNFVLRTGGSNSSATVLWQSFDHPCNTWLPGMKIRFDKRTGKSQRLTSWKNANDPSPGLFSLELDESTAYIILWNGTNQYWSTGPWNPQGKFFDSVPEMTLNYLYNFTFFSNSTESYFIYTVYNQLNLSRTVMDVSGQIKQFTWLDSRTQSNLFWSQPLQQCQVYAYCGSFGICSERSQPFCQCARGFRPKSQKDWDLKDHSAGCVRMTELQCSREDANQFYPLLNMKLADNSEVLSRTSHSSCASACRRNCSCNAYAHDEGSNQCLVWANDVFNLQHLEENNTEGKTLYLRLAASDIRNDSSSKSNKVVILGVVLGSLGVIALVLLVVVLILRYRKRKSYNRKRCTGDENTRERELRAQGLQTVCFTWRQLQAATNNFHEANKLGEGGFGSVFKGELLDGTIIAVKQLSSKSRQGNPEFVNEIGMISGLNHPNLVKLYGCCVEEDQLLLVYEYMENNSLALMLFEKRSSPKLDWKTRQKICVGIARGLEFLHEGSLIKMVHRDIKTSNVLLDADLNAKISDFGLARLYEEEHTHVSTKVAGTIGYMAPEYALWGHLTEKADVYSFGIVVMEIVSGKSNTKQNGIADDHVSLINWALMLQQKGDILEIIDPMLEGEYNDKEAVRMISVALVCTNSSPSLRPTMSEAVQMLEGEIEITQVMSDTSMYGHDLSFSKLMERIANSHTVDMSGNGKSETDQTKRTVTSSVSGYDLYPLFDSESVSLNPTMESSPSSL